MAAGDGERWAGRVLHVDLEGGRCWREELEEQVTGSFLGGRGVNSWLLWRHSVAGCGPLSPGNPLILGAGALGGTHVPASGRVTVTCKSPATGLFLKSTSGGHWGAALRWAGFDHIVVHGKSPRPVYLHLEEGRATLRSAEHLWGKDVRQTNEALRQELDCPDLEVACIGQAGENLVLFAGVMFSVYNTAARGGAGAVMGSKRLKAISVNPRGRLGVASPEEFWLLGLEAGGGGDRYQLKYGTAGGIPVLNELYIFPHRNFRGGRFDRAREISGQRLAEAGYLKRSVACASCPNACHRYVEVNGGPYAGTYTGGPEYESINSLGAGAMVTDLEAIIKANELCNIYGLDTISAGVAAQWLLECAERGLVSSAQVGLPLEWGRAETVVELVRRIAFREGVGDLLAQGVKRASERLGGGSWRWAMQAKGLEQSSCETRPAKGYALAFAVSPRGPDHLYAHPGLELGITSKMRSMVERITGSEAYANPRLVEKRADIVSWHEDAVAVKDSLGICHFYKTRDACGFDLELYAGLFSAATGHRLGGEDLLRAGRRIVNLERCFNVREGASRADDVLPHRLMTEELPDQPGLINSPDELEQMKDRYYTLRGWDLDRGWPRRATLEALGLEEQAGELAGLGRLPE
ncbi:MAG: aldehyde ferredoxin oxidoreductase family protein [Acetobacteraceae bacterium]|nr:aldehyde ferredoxin oxidoreductase family protein [Acetobacteraceae bacterium]